MNATNHDPVTVFWAAPDAQRFKQDEIAAVMRRSEAWMEKARVNGCGPRFQKEGRAVFYVKKDVLAFLSNTQTARSVAEYRQTALAA